MKKAVIITGPGFDDPEVLVSWLYILAEGIAVDIATSTDGEVRGKHGYPIKPTVKISDLDAQNYDAVIIPGGYEAPDRVRQLTSVLDFIRQMHKKNKIVSAICHGPWVLVSAGILKGKKATCYPGMKVDLENAGATYLPKPVVVDGNLITADRPTSSGYWTKAIVNLMK